MRNANNKSLYKNVLDSILTAAIRSKKYHYEH